VRRKGRDEGRNEFFDEFAIVANVNYLLHFHEFYSQH
jgi:hypothetical protein